MANDERLGASFSIDVTALKAGLAQANRLIRESESEFKAAAAGMDDWTESQEGLEARMKHLNATADLQNKKVDALQKEYDRLIADGLDPTSAAAVKLRTDINKEQEALNKTEKEIRAQAKALEELENASDEAADATREAGDAAEDAGDGFTVAKGAIATFIGNGLNALVGAAKNAISSIYGLADSTREYRNEMAKLDTSFQTAGLSAENADKTFSDLYGIMGDEGAAVEAAQQLAKISKDEKDLAANTRILTGVMAEYGSSIPLEGLAEGIAASSSMSSVQGVLADALEWQGVNLDDFNAKLAGLSTEEERAAYIQNELTGLYGKSADAYLENNAAVIEANKAQAKYNDNMAELGKKVEPITMSVREGFNKILEKVLELVNGVDLEAFTAKISTAFDKFINDVLPKIVDGLKWIIDNKDVLIAGIAGIGAAMLTMNVANMIMGVVKSFQAFKAAQEGATVAQWLLNAAMSANPIGLIVAAIVGLVAAFVVLWNKCEGFRNFWIGLWDGLKKAAKAVGDWFVTAFSAVGKFFSDMWKGLGDGAKNAWQGIKNTFSTVADFFRNIFSKAWQGVKNVFSTGGKIFDGIKEGIVSVFKTVVNAIIRGINKIVKKPFQGLNNILDKLHGVQVAGISPFSWLTWRAPIPQLPELATGGVVNQATAAVIGEDGAEAVMPLEKNTGWIKQLAKEIAAEQGNGITINQTNNYKQAYTSQIEKYKSKQQLYATARLIKAGAI